MPPDSHISDLPPEILLHIFSFLPPRDLLAVQCACHYWLQIANSQSLWRDLCRARGFNLDTLEETNELFIPPPPRTSILPPNKYKYVCLHERTVACTITLTHPFEPGKMTLIAHVRVAAPPEFAASHVTGC